MAIYYDFFQNANSIGSNRERYHPRPTHSVTISTDKLIAELREYSGLSASLVTAVLHGLGQSLVRHLSEGDNVHIDGVGSFSISLCAPETRTPSATRASSVKVKSINFRSDKELRDLVSEKAKFVRDRLKTQSSVITEAQILRRLSEFFKSNRTLNRRQFMELTGLNHATALRRIAKLKEMDYIVSISEDKFHPMYIPTSKLDAID